MIAKRPHIRSSVRRPDSEQLILLSLVSFASTVIITRLFLELTGYPQLGNSELHIAHVLWGGLLLFIAALLPLIFLNQWVFTLTAIFGGVGVGLFIDEVGKFITQTNNYFYPPAAPIIYGFFLLTVLVYFQIRRNPRTTSPRVRMYYALHTMAEVLDNDLDANEERTLTTDLTWVAQQVQDPQLAQMARAILEYIQSDQTVVVDRQPTVFERVKYTVLKFLDGLFTKRITRIVLVVMLGIMSLAAIVEVVYLLVFRFGLNIHIPIPLFLTLGEYSAQFHIRWFLYRVALQAAIGILSLIGLVLIFRGDEKHGLFWAQVSLIISLTGLNLIVFYIDQFSAVINTFYQFAIVLLISSYRRRFLVNQSKDRPLISLEKSHPD
ncbi:hypothetical protein LARV_02588 [Longilinea arvoryzae]|uniref:Uncharacterized protein n=1 Tax=Longilinea arvoryzae TaxID=360412 RepID=A0A0S7BAU1_9CHLR|nr:hypothetical protein [Longilinea arvoryzae]GAP14812.1 hypothetical protein LARV_02588 [Longilinea arvoryzae]